MTSPNPLRRHAGHALAGVLALAALYLVTVVYTFGEPLLAGTLLLISALALWTYTSARTMALRYLFPGIAAAVVFVVFPMVYTVSIGFTNYSSTNLLDHDRARQYLLDETFQAPGGNHAYTLHADGGGHRLRLVDQDDETRVYLSPVLSLQALSNTPVVLVDGQAAEIALGEPLPLKDVIARQQALKALTLRKPDGIDLRMASLRSYAPVQPLYEAQADGSLLNRDTGARLRPDFHIGFYVDPAGERVQPGFKVGVGLSHYARIFTDSKFSEPFLRIFGWTLAFSGLTVLFASSLGLLLAVLLNWDSLRFKGVYRMLLFLPYAVPGFISILIFKGLFNQNLGEINLILDGLFGIKPAWTSDPLLAKAMLLIVNTWLGFPYMMVVCMGLIKSIPSDLYEASAVAGAGPLTNFFGITLPLILKPLTPLLISSFAFNFNNFVLITLLTGGRPDFLDTQVPAGTTDILVSYTFRIAFQDSGQQFGLASAISTVIFLIVAAITLVQMRFTRIAAQETR
ncbi:maltose ABC transporter permease MalF [Sphaerotilus mobilis]|uniref:Maltose/maltodextrin transport system permease protein n=1 Tax=Sphaerotilus mobilis TaxID=47994 RepID=A0A4Q7LJH5_9BURK|nr:maltose ABC transporter permease MalF [Sphaerotilus mobilis]RZS54716.1 maltose/maltodextrin transport system permease protein [Sphaerotilus mobilis]